MEDFPDEILVYIFSSLSVSARKRMGLICKRWHNVIWNTKSLSKNFWISLTDSNSSDLCSLPRDFLSITVGDMRSLKSLSFWEANGSKVIALQLRCVVLTSPVLYEILRYCPNLQNLTLFDDSQQPDSYEDFVMPYVDLSNVLHLYLLFTLDLNYSFIPKFTESITKLKELEITGNNPSCYSHYSETAFDVRSLIQKNSKTLTQLKFDCCPFINDTVVVSYLEAVGSQLKGISFSSHELSYSLVNIISLSIAYKFKNREELDLNCNPLNYKGYDMVKLHTSLKQLKRLDLCSTDIDDRLLFGLCQLEQLQNLNLYSCNFLTANGISVAFFENKLINLFDLDLGYLKVITDDVLKVIMPKLPNLTRLNVSNCLNISSAGVGAIVENCKFLRELSLENCVNITDLVSCNISSLKYLTHLRLLQCSNVTGRSVYHFKFRNLVSIDLRTIDVDKESLLALINNCPNLERIWVTRYLLENEFNFRQSIIKPGCVYPILAFG